MKRAAWKFPGGRIPWTETTDRIRSESWLFYAAAQQQTTTALFKRSADVRACRRSRHDEFARDRIRSRGIDPRSRTAGVQAVLSATGLGRARRDRNLGDSVGRHRRS